MVFIFQQLVSFLKLLHAEGSDCKISFAVVLGLFAACSPVWSLQGILCVLIALFFRVQFAAFILSWLVLSICSLALVGLFHQIGFELLSYEPMSSLYILMQQNSLISFTRFYNTAVLGGFVFALLLSFPLYFVTQFLLFRYRDVVVRTFKKTKLYHVLKSSVLFKVMGFYEKYQNI